MSATLPYRSTPVFDGGDAARSLCSARHRTKAGVWGLVRRIEGRLKLTYLDSGSEIIITPELPAVVLPEQPHLVTPLGPMKMQVDFYDQPPGG